MFHIAHTMVSKPSFLRTIVKDFISLFYPEFCLGCSNSLVRGEKLICTRCMLEMPQTNYHLRMDNPLKLRLSGRIPLRHALAFFRFTKRGRIQRILHALKYRNQPDIGVVLGRVYGKKLKDCGYEFDLIVPVPLHRMRLRRRGYNQSEKFAEGLAEMLEIPAMKDVLIRLTKTETQTRKTKLKRWENVSSVFAVSNESSIRGRHVLLVDDVVTTGATLEACATVLVQSGCSDVSVASIAVA